MSLRAILVKVINGLALFGGALLLVIVAVTTLNAAGFSANVIARLWGGTVPGLSGYEDAVQMLVGVAALAMFPYAQLHTAHASVDVFMQYAPKRVSRIFTLLSNVVLTAIVAWMAFMLLQGVLQMRADHVETTVLGWPVWMFMSSAVVSCTLWAVAALMVLSAPQEHSDGA
jgi:TRAP-type C4-dicarboxylate transport system permease small subunit